LECFLNLQDKNDLPFALNLQRMHHWRPTTWSRTVAALLGTPITPSTTKFGDIHVLSYRPNPSAPWKIHIPTQQLRNLVSWFHHALSRCGLHCLLETHNFYASLPPRSSICCRRQHTSLWLLSTSEVAWPTVRALTTT
jgi:hypothetical protein